MSNKIAGHKRKFPLTKLVRFDIHTKAEQAVRSQNPNGIKNDLCNPDHP